MSLLELAGFSPNEAKCYHALLKLGTASANELSRESGIHRVAVYDALRGLREKGMVSQITMTGRMEFSAASPEEVGKIIERKKAELENAKQELPPLLALFESLPEKSEIQVFKGKAGVKQIFTLMLDSSEILDFGAEFHIKDFLPHFYPAWDRERVRKKVRMRIVASKKVQDVKLPLTRMRFVPEELTSNVSTYLYGGKVTLVLWVEPLLACTFLHPAVHESYLNYFEYLWTSARS